MDRFIAKDRKELLLLETYTAMCAFYDNNTGFIDLTMSCIYDIFCLGKASISNVVNEKLVEDVTINGYAKRFKPLYEIEDCPRFMIDNRLSRFDRKTLFAIYTYKRYNMDSCQEFDMDEMIKLKSMFEVSIQSIMKTNVIINELEGISLIAFITKNSYQTKHSLSKMDGYKLDEHGYKYVNPKEVSRIVLYKKISNFKIKCKYCGDENPSHFSGSSIDVCDSCSNKMAALKDDMDRSSMYAIAKKLIARSSLSWRKGLVPNEYNIDVDYIVELIKKQNFRCAYTGIKLMISKDYRFSPTLDRVDSSRGYIKGNVVVVCNFSNVAKSFMEMDDFIVFIEKLYNKLVLKNECTDNIKYKKDEGYYSLKEYKKRSLKITRAEKTKIDSKIILNEVSKEIEIERKTIDMYGDVEEMSLFT